MFNNPLTGYIVCLGIVVAVLVLVYLKVTGFTIGQEMTNEFIYSTTR